LTHNVEHKKIQSEILSLQPLRHRKIRDMLVKIKDNSAAKYHFLKTLEKSENKTKEVLKDQYKHFSEDYPEVQLILQQTVKERIRIQHKKGSKTYSTVKYELGEAYLNENKEFDGIKKKAGIVYSMKHRIHRKHKMSEKKKKRLKLQERNKIRTKKIEKVGGNTSSESKSAKPVKAVKSTKLVKADKSSKKEKISLTNF